MASLPVIPAASSAQPVTEAGTGPPAATLQPVRHRGLDYLPVSLLTERPMVITDIDPELSARFAFIQAQSFELTLLISDYGDVDRVLFARADAGGASEEALPLVLHDELIQRFLDARFVPGRLHGQPVRSALKIRVSLGP